VLAQVSLELAAAGKEGKNARGFGGGFGEVSWRFQGRRVWDAQDGLPLLGMGFGMGPLMTA